MYDFWFGTHDEICADEEKYLLFVKRMLPRWSNSIPDSEYLASHHALSTLDLGGRCPVVVETGVGASTIALLNFAMKHNGVLYSWDPNGPKGALLGELGRISPFLHDGSIVTIDDGNYSYVHTDVSHINMQRRKLNLPPVENPSDNTCESFFREVEQFLRSTWGRVEHLDDTYKKTFKADLFWSYFSSDRAAMAQLEMEKVDALEHRFDSWRVSRCL